MGSALNGIAAHGGLRPYGGTFFVFSDYMRPAIRLAAEARELLAGAGVSARVVSMPSWELFERQPPDYRAQVLPLGMLRLAVEAARGFGWCARADDVVSLDRFGASARQRFCSASSASSPRPWRSAREYCSRGKGSLHERSDPLLTGVVISGGGSPGLASRCSKPSARASASKDPKSRRRQGVVPAMSDDAGSSEPRRG